MPVARRALVLAGLLAGCSCDAPPAVRPAPPAPIEETPRAAALPSTSRADLPELSPMLTVEVSDEGFHLSNVALVASWPAPEREALHRAQPAGEPRWPEVDASVEAHGDDLGIDALRDAFARAANVDRARAAHAGDHGAPIAFALRAAPDVRFARVMQAIYAAGLAGYAEPRLVMLAPSHEVALALPLPRARAGADADLAERLAAAFATLGTPPRTPSVEAPEPDEAPALAPTPTAALVVSLAGDGVRVTRDDAVLAPGCAAPLDGALTLPADTLTPSALNACLDAAGEAVSISFRTARDTRYADAVAVIETLAARGPLGLTTDR